MKSFTRIERGGGQAEPQVAGDLCRASRIFYPTLLPSRNARKSLQTKGGDVVCASLEPVPFGGLFPAELSLR
jgi:hypothetical protein